MIKKNNQRNWYGYLDCLTITHNCVTSSGKLILEHLGELFVYYRYHGIKHENTKSVKKHNFVITLLKIAIIQYWIYYDFSFQ